MLRRLLLVLLALLFLAGLAGAGLYAARTDLAQWLAARQLAALGLPEARLTVEEFGWDRARLTGLSAGRNGELRLEQAVLRYRLPRLLGGRLEQVSLVGLALRLDLTGEGPPLGSLQAPLEVLLGDSDAGSSADTPPPLVMIEAGEIEALTPFGPARLVVEGRVVPEAGGAVAAELGLALTASRGKLLGRLTARAEASGAITGGLRVERGALTLGAEELSAQVLAGGVSFQWRDERLESLEGQLAFDAILLHGTALGAAALSLAVTPARLTASGKIGPEDGAFDLRFRTEVDDYATAPQIDSELALSASAAASLWRFLPEPRPEAGDFRFALSARGRLPGGAPQEGTPEALWSWLSDADLAGDLSLDLEAVKLAGLAETIDATLPATLSLERGQLTSGGDMTAELAGLSPTLLEALGLPPSWLGERLSIALAGTGEAPFTARLGPDRLAFTGMASLSAPDRLDLSAVGSAELAFDPAFRPRRLSTEKLALTAAIRALAGTPVRSLALQGDLSGTLDLAAAQDAPRLVHELALEDGKLDLALDRKAAPPLTVKADKARILLAGGLTAAGLYGGEVSVTGAGLVLPELALAMEGVSARLPIADGAVTGGIELAASVLRDLEKPARFHPLRASGRLQPRGETLEIRASLTGAAGTGRVDISGRQSLDGTGAGEARAVLEPLDFQPGGTQPDALSPLLDGLNEVSGQVEAEARFTWGAKGLDSTASIASNALSFESGGVTFTGLKGALTLDRLAPLSSPPGQILTAASIDPGVPLNDVQVSYQLLPGEPVLARVEAAAFSSLGGDYRVGETLIDPAAPRQEILLEVVDLDLADLFDEIEIEGLSGTGSLAGTLPLSIGPEGVSLTKGLLTSNEKGVLRFHSPAAAEALKSGGQPVELMLQALEDFHYGRLVLRANKQADGETRLRIKLKGKNPDLLEGQRFNFNISLTGNLDPVLSALAQGRALSNKLLGGAWKLE